MKVSPRKVGLITSCSLVFALALTFLAHSGDFRNGTSDIYAAGSRSIHLSDSSQHRRGDHLVIYHHVLGLFTLSNSSHFLDHRSETETSLSKIKEKKDAVNETLNYFNRKNKVADHLRQLTGNRMKQIPLSGKRRTSDGISKKNSSTENRIMARLCKKANGKIDHLSFFKTWYKVLRIRYPNFKFWLTDILRNCFKDFKKSATLQGPEDKIILKGILNTIIVTNKPTQKNSFEKFLTRDPWPNKDFAKDEPLHPIPVVFHVKLILPTTGQNILVDSVSNQREFLSKLYPYPLYIAGGSWSRISKQLIPTAQLLHKTRYRESTFSIPSKKKVITTQKIREKENANLSVKQKEASTPRLTKQDTSTITVQQQKISTSDATQQDRKILRLDSFNLNAAGNVGSKKPFRNTKATNGKGNDETKRDSVEGKQISGRATDDSAANEAVGNYLAREVIYLLEIMEKLNPFSVEDKHFIEENRDNEGVNANKFDGKKQRNVKYEEIKSATKDSSSKNGNGFIRKANDNESSEVGAADLHNVYDETKTRFNIDGKLSGSEMIERLKNDSTLCSGNCSKESKDAKMLRKSRNDFQRIRRSLKPSINTTQLSENLVQRAQNRNKTGEMISLNDNKGKSEIRSVKPARQGMLEVESEKFPFSEGKRDSSNRFTDSLNSNETIDDRRDNSFLDMNQARTENQQTKEKGTDGIESDDEEMVDGTEENVRRESDAEATEEENTRYHRDDAIPPSISEETSAHSTPEMPYEETHDDSSYREKTTESGFSSSHTPHEKRIHWRLVDASASQGVTTDVIKYDSHKSHQLVPSNVIQATTEKMSTTKDDLNEDAFHTTDSSVREEVHRHDLYKPIKALPPSPEVWTEASQYSSVDDPQRQPKMSGTTSGSNASFKKQSVFSKDDYSSSYEDKSSKVYIAHNVDFSIPEFRPGTFVHAPVLLPREPLQDDDDDDDSFETVDKVQPGYFLVFRNRDNSGDSEAFDPSIKGVRVISSTFYPHRLKEISLHYTNQLENSTTSDSEGTDSSIVSQDQEDEDEEADHPWFTMEKLAYLLIGSSCALSILCLLVVIAAIKCRHLLVERRLRQQFRRQLYHPSTWQQNLYGQFMYLHGQPTNSFSSQDSCNCRCVTWSLGARNLDSQPICTTRQSTVFLCGPKKLPFGAASTLRSESMLGRDRRATRPPPPKPESSNENDSLEQSSSSESSSKECTCIDPHWTSSANHPAQQSSAHHTFGKDIRFRNSKECELPLLRHELQSINSDCPPPVRGSNYLDKAEGVVYWSSNDERLI